MFSILGGSGPAGAKRPPHAWGCAARPRLCGLRGPPRGDTANSRGALPP